jgi:hypothetical protein
MVWYYIHRESGAVAARIYGPAIETKEAYLVDCERDIITHDRVVLDEVWDPAVPYADFRSVRYLSRWQCVNCSAWQMSHFEYWIFPDIVDLCSWCRTLQDYKRIELFNEMIRWKPWKKDEYLTYARARFLQMLLDRAISVFVEECRRKGLAEFRAIYSSWGERVSFYGAKMGPFPGVEVSIFYRECVRMRKWPRVLVYPDGSPWDGVVLEAPVTQFQTARGLHIMVVGEGVGVGRFLDEDPPKWSGVRKIEPKIFADQLAEIESILRYTDSPGAQRLLRMARKRVEAKQASQAA